MEKKKKIISVAPVFGGKLPEDAHNPLSPDELADDVASCVEAGASIVHLHVRDLYGAVCSDLSVFHETVSRIRSKCDSIIQASTGGTESESPELRCISLDEPNIEMASLNIGSTNFFNTIYRNSPDDIRYWARKMQSKGIIPELEVFSLNMIHFAEILKQENLIQAPFRFSLCAGIPNAIPSDPRYIYYFAHLLPENALWGFIHHGMKDFSLLCAALALGATWVRVGYEDSPYYEGNKIAASNKELVFALTKAIKKIGYGPATCAETRSILDVPQH